MSKWSLFMLSIGLLILLFSANARTGEYDILNLTTALFLVGFGIYHIYRGKKQKKNEKE